MQDLVRHHFITFDKVSEGVVYLGINALSIGRGNICPLVNTQTLIMPATRGRLKVTFRC